MNPSRAPRPAKRHRGLVLLAALVSTFALVGGGYVAVTTYLSGTAPSSVVTSYFAALERGDAAKALSYGSVPPGTRAYLNDDVLRQQLAAGAISNVQVESVNQGRRSAQVSVSYQLRSAGGQRTISDVVPMVRRGRQWRLAESAVPTTVDLFQASRRAVLAGAAFPAHPVPLFPGALPVTFDTPNLALNPTGPTTVGFGRAGTGALVVMASTAGVGAARTAVAAALGRCLSGTAGSGWCPTPSGESERAVPGSLRGSLTDTALSTLKVQVSGDVNGVLSITGMVDVNGSYQSLDFANVASVVRASAIPVLISAHCYVTSIASSLRWDASP